MKGAVYIPRFLERFAEFLGPAEIKHDSSKWLTNDSNLRKLPLLDQVVLYHLGEH